MGGFSTSIWSKQDHSFKIKPITTHYILLFVVMHSKTNLIILEQHSKWQSLLQPLLLKKIRTDPKIKKNKGLVCAVLWHNNSKIETHKLQMRFRQFGK